VSVFLSFCLRSLLIYGILISKCGERKFIRFIFCSKREKRRDYQSFIGPKRFSRFRRNALSTPVTTAVTETEPFSSWSTLAPQMFFAFGGNERFMISAAWLTSNSVRSSPPATWMSKPRAFVFSD
jgi:hypothetical protein